MTGDKADTSQSLKQPMWKWVKWLLIYLCTDIQLEHVICIFMELLVTQTFKAVKWLQAKVAYSTDMLTIC